MISQIPIFIVLEKVINLLINIIYNWFDLIFPYLVIDEYSSYYDIISKNSYMFSVCNLGYKYMSTDERKNKHILVPLGFSIFIIDNYYCIINHEEKKGTFVYIIRYLNPFNTNFIKLLNYITRVNKNNDFRTIYSVTEHSYVRAITTVPKYKNNIRNDLIDSIKNLYIREIKNKYGNNNLSVMFYGKPGTGKSTQVSALSYLLNMDILNITIESINPNNILTLYNKENIILLFEDWFPAFINEYFINKSIYKNENKNFSVFLNIMSGLSAVKNCLFIFTCNSVDEIYKEPQIYPLFRKGRINNIYKFEKNCYVSQRPEIKNNILCFK
jgi:hypothetical protein